MLKKQHSFGFLLLFSILLSLIIPATNLFVSAETSVTYSGNLSCTSTTSSQDDPYNYPDQALSRTCVISYQFTGLTLSSYDGGSTYSGSVTGQATYTSDWEISPASATSSVGVTRAFSPALGHTSSGFEMQIYAEINGGIMTFILSPSSALLQSSISTSYTYATSTQPAGTAMPVTYTSPTNDAYTALYIYGNTEGNGVTVPKSSNPFQTQTIQFSGSHPEETIGIRSFTWTGTITLNLGNQATDTASPTPSNNQENPTNNPTNNPTSTPTNVPQPGTAAAQISNLLGNIQVTRAGSNTPQTVTAATTLNVGDRVTAGADSYVTVTYSDDSKFDLSPGCEITIEDRTDNNQYKNIQLLNGLMHLWEQIQSGGRRFRVHAIAFAMSIRGSELTIEANDTGITVTVIDGSVDVENTQSGDTVTLEAGQTISVTSDMSQQQMEQNIQSINVSSVDRWWDRAYPNSTGIIIAIIVAVVVAVVLVVLLMVRRRKLSANSMISPLPPPPPPT